MRIQTFSVEAVEEALGIHFHNPDLLIHAFVHRSYWNEQQDKVAQHNERLEFLGDSVLGLLVAEYLFRQYPHLDEGSLSTLRSQLVDAPACASYVQQLAIERFLLLGKGELLNRGKGRESILADLFEAVIGAMYIDQGLEVVRIFLFRHFQPAVDKLVLQPLRNWKAELQDYAQKNYQQVPVYQVIDESGPAHRRHFRVGVWVQDILIGEGEGSSKKEAQTQAARAALESQERE